MRPDGRISTPLIADMVAAGKTPTQLARDMSQRLKKFIQDPNVTVIVQRLHRPADRQIRVIGEATDPTGHPLPGRPYRPRRDDRHQGPDQIRRRQPGEDRAARPGGKQQTIHVRLSDLLKDGDISQNVDMQPGDTLIIPQSLVLSRTVGWTSSASCSAATAWRRRNRWFAVAWLVGSVAGWVVVYTIPNQYQLSARLYVDADAILTPLLHGLALDEPPTNQLDVLQRTLLSRPNLEKLISKTRPRVRHHRPGRPGAAGRRPGHRHQGHAADPQPVHHHLPEHHTETGARRGAELLTIFIESAIGTNRTDMDNARAFLEQQIAL